MARGSVTKRGNAWRIAVELEPDPQTSKRRQRFETFHGSKKEAEKRLTELLALADQQRLGAPQSMTVGAFLDRWLTDYARQKAPKTYQRYQEIVRNWLAPHLGAVRLDKLTASHVVRLQTTLRDAPRKDGKPGNLSAQSVRHAHRCLHTALECAVKWGVLPFNPAARVDAPSVPKTEMRTFSPEQARAFLDAASQESTKWQAFFATAMTTGLRMGEIIALRWQDVDLDGATARVQQTMQRLNHVGLVVKPPKTAGSRRPVALGADVVALLRKHRAEQIATRLQMGPLWEDRGLVFPSERGTPLHDKTIKAVFLRVCERAGVPRIRLYDLRHTAASLLLASGVHPKVVAERLGHSTVNLTLNTYSHVLPTLQKDAADELDKLLRAR